MRYLLKIKHGLKTKNLLPLFWNYQIFSFVFNTIIVSPQYILLFLSIQQKKIYKLKKFLFYKIKKINFRKDSSNLLLVKQTLESNKFNQFFLLVLNHLFFHIIKLLYLQIFSFTPFKFRFNSFKTTPIDFEPTRNSNFYILKVNLFDNKYHYLLKNSLKFIKKFINDNTFNQYCLQVLLFLFQSLIKKKFFWLNFLQLKYLLNNIYCKKFDFFIFSFITTFILNVYINVSPSYKKIFFLLKISLQRLNKRNKFLNVFLKKKYVKFQYFNYLRNNNEVLICFFSSFYNLYFFREYLHLYTQLTLKITSNILKSCMFFGYKISTSFFLNKSKQQILWNWKKNPFTDSLFLYFVPIKKLKYIFICLNILNSKNKPRHNNTLISLEANNIFEWYLKFFLTFKFYYKNCLNFKMFILRLFYICKWALLICLAKKHKKVLSVIIYKYSKYTKVFFMYCFNFLKLINKVINYKCLCYIYNKNF